MQFTAWTRGGGEGGECRKQSSYFSDLVRTPRSRCRDWTGDCACGADGTEPDAALPESHCSFLTEGQETESWMCFLFSFAATPTSSVAQPGIPHIISAFPLQKHTW